MSMFDTFSGYCTNCGNAAFESQTKLFVRQDKVFRVGMKIWDLAGPEIENPLNFVLELKNPCQVCGLNLLAVVDKGILSHFDFEGTPTIREGISGSILPIGVSHKEDEDNFLSKVLSANLNIPIN